jgi:hypothetical protein
MSVLKDSKVKNGSESLEESGGVVESRRPKLLDSSDGKKKLPVKVICLGDSAVGKSK